MNNKLNNLSGYLKKLPYMCMGNHPMLGKITFNVTRFSQDDKGVITIDWMQKMSKTSNYLKGKTILAVKEDELRVTNCDSLKRPLNDIAGAVVYELANKFQLECNYDRKNTATFSVKLVDSH